MSRRVCKGVLLIQNTRIFSLSYLHQDPFAISTVHRGAFLTIFVRISTDKQNTWIFGNFSDQLDEILKDSCDFWRFLEIFGPKVWNFSS